MESLIGALPDVTLLIAETGPAGIDAALAHEPDIVVLDMQLPGMSGLEVMQQMRTLPSIKSTPMIALSAASQPEEIRAGLDAGFDRYVTKPLDVKAFLTVIEESMKSRPRLKIVSGKSA